MTFQQICKRHIADHPMQFSHPDLIGIYTFEHDGKLTYQQHGLPCREMPFYLSDFDRDDWEIIF